MGSMTKALTMAILVLVLGVGLIYMSKTLCETGDSSSMLPAEVKDLMCSDSDRFAFIVAAGVFFLCVGVFMVYMGTG